MGCVDCLFCWKKRAPPSPPASPRKPPVDAAAVKIQLQQTSDASTTNGNAHGSGSGPAPRRGNVKDFYSLGKVIGSGSYSVVREATDKETKTRYAIKVIKRAELTAEDDEAILTEVEILKAMDHPHIMTLREFFVEPEHYYLVTEFVSGGELFDRIVEKTFYSEKEARDLVRILLDAIRYCHDKDVVHRDLKPENLLLTSATDDASIKLADFGFAKKVEVDNAGLVTTCGTPGYVAPEILEGESYGKPVDIWSIGIITYILLAGYPPFHDDSQPILFRKIRKGKYQFDSPYWDNVSQDAKDFIGCMLVTDPAKRATAADLLQHKWITGSEVATVPLTSALTELRRFHARKKFKAAVLSVQTTIAMNRALTNSASSSSSLAKRESESSTVSV